jgi:hypothetical protein
MNVPNYDEMVLYIFAGYGFLAFLQKMALAFVKDWLREWWDFKEWTAKTRAN